MLHQHRGRPTPKRQQVLDKDESTRGWQTRALTQLWWATRTTIIKRRLARRTTISQRISRHLCNRT